MRKRGINMYTADRETGTFIEEVESVEQGLRVIATYERMDKANGCYSPDFYDVVDSDHCSLIN